MDIALSPPWASGDGPQAGDPMHMGATCRHLTKKPLAFYWPLNSESYSLGDFELGVP